MSNILKANHDNNTHKLTIYQRDGSTIKLSAYDAISVLGFLVEHYGEEYLIKMRMQYEVARDINEMLVLSSTSLSAPVA